MSILGDCTSVRDLAILENLRNAAHQRGMRRVVMVQNLDGTTETDLEWLARQAELDDYYRTMHDASYRGQ